MEIKSKKRKSIVLFREAQVALEDLVENRRHRENVVVEESQSSVNRRYERGQRRRGFTYLGLAVDTDSDYRRSLLSAKLLDRISTGSATRTTKTRRIGDESS